MIDVFLKDALKKRKESGLLRTLIQTTSGIDFCSNDYLGLAQALNGEKLHGSGGSTGSRLISGNSEIAEILEAKLASFHHAEAALIFNTGYMANLGLFSSIADRETTYIYDEHIHASIIDGMRLSLANRYKFKHNNINDLEKKLSLGSGKMIVVVESVYSMDGDLAPLIEIATLCKKYYADLIVDEAHATGIYGNKGEGLVCSLGLEEMVFARIHTFGKALGSHGAVVACSVLLHDFLINYARSFIYTTALPDDVLLNIGDAYQKMEHADRSKLFKLISYFSAKATVELQEHNKVLANPSPIQAIMVPGNSDARAMANHLQIHGFFVKAILSPTVPKGSERIRICLHSFNTFEDIDRLIQAVKSIKK